MLNRNKSHGQTFLRRINCSPFFVSFTETNITIDLLDDHIQTKLGNDSELGPAGLHQSFDIAIISNLRGPRYRGLSANTINDLPDAWFLAILLAASDRCPHQSSPCCHSREQVARSTRILLSIKCNHFDVDIAYITPYDKVFFYFQLSRYAIVKNSETLFILIMT